MIPLNRKINMLSVVLVLIMILSWILNFGMLRLTLTVVLFPVFHALLFILANWFSAQYIKESKWLKIVTILSFITFLLPHLIVSDFTEKGESYFFFGLIKSESFPSFSNPFGAGILVLNIVIFILQFVLVGIHKRKLKKSG